MNLLHTIETNGELDNTYVIFTSDHGYRFGQVRTISNIYTAPLTCCLHACCNVKLLEHDMWSSFLWVVAVRMCVCSLEWQWERCVPHACALDTWMNWCFGHPLHSSHFQQKLIEFFSVLAGVYATQWNVYENDVRIPFMISGPGISKNTSIPHLASQVGFFTKLEFWTLSSDC